MSERFKRGDKHPTKEGLYFKQYNTWRGKKYEIWLTLAAWEKVKEKEASGRARRELQKRVDAKRDKLIKLASMNNKTRAILKMIEAGKSDTYIMTYYRLPASALLKLKAEHQAAKSA